MSLASSSAAMNALTLIGLASTKRCVA